MKMNRLATLAALGALLIAAPSFATDAQPTNESAVSTAAPVVKQAPVRRQTTVERWRGGPRRAYQSDNLVRNEALDKTLPIVMNTTNITGIPGF